MFDTLATAIDDLHVPVDGDALAEVLALRDRFEARLCAAVCAFDDTGQWDTQDGCASMTGWLRVRGRMTNRDAHRLARTARRLRGLPTLRAAWIDGSISGGHIAAVTATLTDRTAPLFAQHEDDLVPVLAGLDVADAVKAMKHWAIRATDTLDDPSEEPDRDRAAHLSPTLTGGRLDADLDTEGFATAHAALRLAMGPRTDDDLRTPTQRRHDALVAVFAHYLDHQTTARGGHHRPHINITIGLEALQSGTGQGTFDDGTPITATDARRIACDAGIHRVITRADGTVLDYGRTTRTISASLFNVLALRDQGCRFPGCDRGVGSTDAHHIHHWIDHGPTEPDNLVLLCRWHHGVIHRPDWHIELQPDTTIVVTSPDGRRRTSRPPATSALVA